jgi:Kef-type K+ transport system membrane component KefB
MAMSRLSWTEIVRTVFEIVSGLAALIFIYQYFQSADQPDRQRMFLLLGLVAVVVLLVFIGRGLLNWVISRARMAVRFVQQNALLVASLLLAGGLVCLLLQRTQDVVLAGATVGLVLTGTGIGVGAVRLLSMTRPC